MFKLVPFEMSHFDDFYEQPSNSFLKAWVVKWKTGLIEKDQAVSGIVNGQVMVCGGITQYWDGRGHVWSVFNEKSKQNFLPVFRGIKKWLSEQPYRRIELSVPLNFPLGCRRAEMLGFEWECRAKNYLPDGSDVNLYVLTKGGV